MAGLERVETLLRLELEAPGEVGDEGQ
jgi:hypothetical protein